MRIPSIFILLLKLYSEYFDADINYTFELLCKKCTDSQNILELYYASSNVTEELHLAEITKQISQSKN